MALVTPLRPMADGTLIEFFMNEERSITGKRLRRIEAAHADLLACFDEHGPALLADADECDLQGICSVARIVPPRAIIDVLPFFLDEPRWHGDDLVDRRLRSELTWRLARLLLDRFDLQGSEPFEAVRMAVWRSRTCVRRVKAEAANRDFEERRIRLENAPWRLGRPLDGARSSGPA